MPGPMVALAKCVTKDGSFVGIQPACFVAGTVTLVGLDQVVTVAGLAGPPAVFAHLQTQFAGAIRAGGANPARRRRLAQGFGAGTPWQGGGHRRQHHRHRRLPVFHERHAGPPTRNDAR